MNAEKTTQYAVSAMASAQNIGDLSAQPTARTPAIGRDPGSLRRSLYYSIAREADPWASVDAFQEVVGRYREVGIDEFILDHPKDEQLGVLEKVAADVLPKLRQA